MNGCRKAGETPRPAGALAMRFTFPRPVVNCSPYANSFLLRFYPIINVSSGEKFSDRAIPPRHRGTPHQGWAESAPTTRGVRVSSRPNAGRGPCRDRQRNRPRAKGNTQRASEPKRGGGRAGRPLRKCAASIRKRGGGMRRAAPRRQCPAQEEKARANGNQRQGARRDGRRLPGRPPARRRIHPRAPGAAIFGLPTTPRPMPRDVSTPS